MRAEGGLDDVLRACGVVVVVQLADEGVRISGGENPSFQPRQSNG